MKIVKFVIAVLIVASILSTSTFSTLAVSNIDDIFYFEDGSFICISMQVKDMRTGNGKSASKTYTYYSKQNEIQWTATLYATFEYDGTEYWTTDCSIETNIYNSAWYEISKSSSMSGCGATGEVTMGKKTLGITVNRESATITLSCSPHGTIS